jgi:ribosomal protein S18 acetylase RimI-like enzyme
MAARRASGTIRRALAADAEAVSLLHARSRAAYYADGGVGVPVYFDDRVAWWIGELLRTDAVTWIAEDDELAGLMHAGWSEFDDKREFHLMGLYVAPELWGNGVAGALYDVFITELENSGATGAVLEVWSSNDRAIHVWQHLGWNFDGSERPALEGTTYRRMRLAHPVGDASG